MRPSCRDHATVLCSVIAASRVCRYLCHRVQKYSERRGAAHVTVGVSVACKLMRACSRDLPQLLGSMRSLTSFLLLHSSTHCNVQGMLLLHEFAEHRHGSVSALLHTFNSDICALMAKAATAAAQPADVAIVHGTLTARAAAFDIVTRPAATAINTAVFLVKELCDPGSTVTDAVSKQVLGKFRASCCSGSRKLSVLQVTSYPLSSSTLSPRRQSSSTVQACCPPPPRQWPQPLFLQKLALKFDPV